MVFKKKKNVDPLTVKINSDPFGDSELDFPGPPSMGDIRQFMSGATRDADAHKVNYIGALSWQVLERFVEYMKEHRDLSDGTRRADDNWKKSIPRQAYMESLARHFVDLWSLHDMGDCEKEIEDTLCALFFNVQGYLYEVLNGR